MVVYELRPDVNVYQFFLPHDLNDCDSLIFDCDERGKDWQVPRVYIERPKLRRGNFLGVNLGSAFCCDDATLWKGNISSLLGMSNELIPFVHEGETYHIVNVLECINALDRERSIWSPYAPGIGGPRTHAFHPARIPETPLFKIPEESKTTVFCHEGLGDTEDEFKREYDRLGLSGLKFVKVWDSKA